MKAKLLVFISLALLLVIVVILSQVRDGVDLGQKVAIGFVSGSTVYLISNNVTCAIQVGGTYTNNLPNGSKFTPSVPENTVVLINYNYEGKPTGTYYNVSGNKISCFRVFYMGQIPYFLFPFAYNGSIIKASPK